MDAPEQIVVMTTLEAREDAERIGRALVQEQLVACAQLLATSSYFSWEGKLTAASETLVLLKTRADLYPRVEARISELHPYEVPEILAVPVSNGLPAYTAWIDKVTLRAT